MDKEKSVSASRSPVSGFKVSPVDYIGSCDTELKHVSYTENGKEFRKLALWVPATRSWYFLCDMKEVTYVGKGVAEELDADWNKKSANANPEVMHKFRG